MRPIRRLPPETNVDLVRKATLRLRSRETAYCDSHFTRIVRPSATVNVYTVILVTMGQER